MEKLYPVFLNLSNIPCLIVGGGAVAFRKAKRLIEFGAQVTVISLDYLPELRGLSEAGNLALVEREVVPEDVLGYKLVFCATNNARVNKEIASAAEAAGALVNVADAPEASSFFVPALLDRDRLQIAVSTSGASPALARLIRQDLEEHFGSEWELILAVEQFLRPMILERIPAEERTDFLRGLAVQVRDICGSAENPGQLRETLENLLGWRISAHFEQLMAPYFR